jgi:hypothetical protein
MAFAGDLLVISRGSGTGLNGGGGGVSGGGAMGGGGGSVSFSGT